MNGQTPVTVQSYTQTDYGASITLASAVADGVESLTVSWLAGDFLDGQTALAAGSIVAGRIGAKYTFINVINNTGAQGFGYGDYVVVDVTPVPITDKQNPAVSKTCYRVIGSMTAGVLHNHAGLGVLGQGTAPAILGA
jgi:hypothetical protein